MLATVAPPHPQETTTRKSKTGTRNEPNLCARTYAHTSRSCLSPKTSRFHSSRWVHPVATSSARQSCLTAQRTIARSCLMLRLPCCSARQLCPTHSYHARPHIARCKCVHLYLSYSRTASHAPGSDHHSLRSIEDVQHGQCFTTHLHDLFVAENNCLRKINKHLPALLRDE